MKYIYYAIVISLRLLKSLLIIEHYRLQRVEIGLLCRPCHSLTLAYLLQEVVYVHALIDIEEECDPLPDPHILYAHSLEFTGRIQIGLILSGLESSVRINNETATATAILLIFTGL